MKKLSVLLFTVLLAGLFILSSCSDSDDNGTNNNGNQLPIVGSWVSEGQNVAPLLLSLGIVKIEATFNDDNTYTVVSYDTAMAPTTLTGTYTAEKSAVDTIYTITVNQTSPTALTSQGIFSVNESKNPAEMLYEIVQTEPSIGATPPTPEAGFGSTNGGALGTWNIQKYLKVVN
ncbi:MAG: hypothetical protein Kow00108_14240 [Calditrichia bacterium]